ncbi:MAG TPA: hypothetical protein VGQ59_08165 [Cyclobacteriaceae bacterium]|jgi:peptidyl-tRNA hydrolase|nr:hypothetical protein [Cyclobacteriaceae bacterium]
MKTSINIKPAKIRISEAHNERRVKLDYVLPEFEGNHQHWKNDSISNRLTSIKQLYFQEVGQTMQPNSSPVREGVVGIKPETTMNDLRELGSKLKERFGIECFQIHIHHDEGHVVTEDEAKTKKALGDNKIKVGTTLINYHAHLIFDWQDKKTGRSFKLNRADTSEMQTLTAQVLGMERGETNSKATRLEAKEFKAFRQKLNADVGAELTQVDERKSKALRELSEIEELKKKSMLGLLMLEAEGKRTKQSFEESKKNYDLTLRKLQDSREELKRLEPKIKFTKRLEDLPWASCADGHNVSFWLAKQSLHRTEIHSGKDGSIYFKQGELVARVKDMKSDVQVTILKKLKLDTLFQNQQAMKWGNKLGPQKFKLG